MSSTYKIGFELLDYQASVYSCNKLKLTILTDCWDSIEGKRQRPQIPHYVGRGAASLGILSDQLVICDSLKHFFFPARSRELVVQISSNPVISKHGNPSSRRDGARGRRVGLFQ